MKNFRKILRRKVIFLILWLAMANPRHGYAQVYRTTNKVRNNDTTNIKNSTSKEGIILCPPLKKVLVTSGFGLRVHPILKTWQTHNGLDLKAKNDTVFMIADGKIEKVAYDPRSGIYIATKAGDIELIFCHLSQIFVLPGDTLEAGEAIGLTGQTGTATAEHLHLIVKYKGEYVNPARLVSFLSGQQFEKISN